MKNPFRYRGYVWDAETELYYLGSRYYDAEVGRFLNPDVSEALSAKSGTIYDHNLYAYCDNNPIVRKDAGGYFWHLLATAVVGVATQYITDVLENLKSGEKEFWKPRSSRGEYIAAGLTAIIPGSGLGNAFLQSAATEGIRALEVAIHGKKIDVVDTVKAVAVGTFTGLLVGKTADKVESTIKANGPGHYFEYAKKVRKTAPKLPSQVIKKRLRRARIWTAGLGSAAGFGVNVLGNFVVSQ